MDRRSRRIALFTDSFYPELGGIQDSIAATAQALGQRGYVVRIFAPAACPADYAVANLPVGEIDLGRNVSIHRLRSLPVPGPTRQSRLVIPHGWRWRDVAAFSADLIHTQTFFGAGWEALRAARRLRLPLVGTNHWVIGEFGNYVPLPTRTFARASVGLVTWYYDHCSMVTAPSRTVLQEMQDRGLRSAHCVVSNPIDTDTFHPVTAEEKLRLKTTLGFATPTIVYAGRLAVEKNIDILVRALALLRQDFPTAMLVLAGHGTDQQRLERSAEEHNVAQHVRFLGTLDKASLADVFRAADVFAIASTSESQSMTLLQAMSCGLPAVGARWRALPEYITSASGLLATPGEPADFARQLVTILSQPMLQQTMCLHAHRAARRFSVATVVDAWEDIYARTIRAYRHGSPQTGLGNRAEETSSSWN